ncbi:GDSL-type esterase/lipase family protein [Sphingomonas sp. ASY06-1R]|uniref:GDSL-type esterase/lipase family protein n=1 Tax=Sphingomonas sp. ASY06-1R TaxID=3445771 RepID=UPI003FA30B05
MIALAAAAALSFAGNCVGSLCGVNELSPFLAKLHQAGSRPVNILQIGDSHTAGDTITGAWRDILQQKYGSAGRGILPPGRPFNGYITQGATVSMSPDWQIAGDFGSAWSSPSPPLGISAYSLTTRTDGASMSIAADPNQAFNRFVVCAIMRPGGGKLQMRAGVNSITFDLSSPTERPECRTLRLSSLVTSADVIASDGQVTMTSWATFHDGGSGVTLSNLGVVGSQLVHWARTDDAVLTEELRTYKPDLIVIAFGTNEGFSPRVSDFEFEATLRTQIGRVRRIAGNVPILLLGAPDALSRRAEMRANASNGPSPNCGTPMAVAAPPRENVVTSIMNRLRDTMGLSSDTPAQPDPAPVAPPPPAVVNSGTTRGPLFPPAGLKAVRDMQRRVAASLNVAFWDWEAAMGGRCTADRWVHMDPPMMRGDYVHYTSAGGREIARRLENDIEKAGGR